jgi:hypothetical protein
MRRLVSSQGSRLITWLAIGSLGRSRARRSSQRRVPRNRSTLRTCVCRPCWTPVLVACSGTRAPNRTVRVRCHSAEREAVSRGLTAASSSVRASAAPAATRPGTGRGCDGRGRSIAGSSSSGAARWSGRADAPPAGSRHRWRQHSRRAAAWRCPSRPASASRICPQPQGPAVRGRPAPCRSSGCPRWARDVPHSAAHPSRRRLSQPPEDLCNQVRVRLATYGDGTSRVRRNRCTRSHLCEAARRAARPERPGRSCLLQAVTRFRRLPTRNLSDRSGARRPARGSLPPLPAGRTSISKCPPRRWRYAQPCSRARAEAAA